MHDDRLPDVVNGDQDMLMLSIQTLTEFTIRYAPNGTNDD